MAITIAQGALVGICITYARLYVGQATASNTMFRGAMGGALIGSVAAMMRLGCVKYIKICNEISQQ